MGPSLPGVHACPGIQGPSGSEIKGRQPTSCFTAVPKEGINFNALGPQYLKERCDSQLATPKSWNMDAGWYMLVFFLSVVWDWRTFRFQLSGFHGIPGTRLSSSPSAYVQIY